MNECTHIGLDVHKDTIAVAGLIAWLLWLDWKLTLGGTAVLIVGLLVLNTPALARVSPRS